ncbi:hypothetical protein AOLI_G00324410 [Acnodon oligacanthus]
MSSVSASAHYLRTSFGLTDDVLNQIHTEVTAVLRTLALERKDVLSIKAAVTFTSTLLDDLLDQINSTFMDLFVYANSPHGSPLTATFDLDQKRNSSTEEVDRGIEEFENHSKLQDSRLSKNRSRLCKVKTPKISFKKQRNGEEPMTVLSEKQTEENPRNSPCGDLTPRNQLDPDFFFIIEVSNKETASSPFCEDTLLFELHVHGFPLDPVRGLFFIQMTMTAIQTILVCYIGHTCWRLRRKTVCTKKRDALTNKRVISSVRLVM